MIYIISREKRVGEFVFLLSLAADPVQKGVYIRGFDAAMGGGRL